MKFLKENWFKLMTGTSMLVFSFAFLMYAVSPSYANYTKEETPSKSDYALVPLNKDGSINVKMSGIVNSYCYYYDGSEWKAFRKD